MRSNIARTWVSSNRPGRPSCATGAGFPGPPALWLAGTAPLLELREEVDDRIELLRRQVLERRHRRRRVHERARDALPGKARGDVGEVRPRPGVAVLTDLVTGQASRLGDHLRSRFVFGERLGDRVCYPLV